MEEKRPEIIIGDRGSGRTTELIKKSAKEGKYIVCRDRDRVDLICYIAKRLGIKILQPIPFTEWESRHWYAQETARKGILIDDLDDIIQDIFRVPILAVTMEKDDRQITELNKNG